MQEYFQNIYNGIKTLISGMSISYTHFNKRKELNATLQYPHEKWPKPERNIGHENKDYNLIRSRLHVDIDDCIGCLQCERACPVDCIKIDVVKPPKGSDFDCGLTSHDTQKKMIVPRFSIDMSECMYCNLCVYPCPEECIYMVGGPNSEKHEIDYEYSQRQRNGLIYEFGVSTDEEIIGAGGESYIQMREKIQEKRENANNVAELEKIAQEITVTSDKEEKEEKIIKPEGPKPNFSPIDEIDDKPTRGIAKRSILRSIRNDISPDKAAEMIKKDLEEFNKYKPEYDEILTKISSQPLMDQKDVDEKYKKEESGIENESENKVLKPEENNENESNKEDNKKEVETTKEDVLDIKMLNSITDRVTRGLAKKTFMGSQRDGKSPNEIADDIQSVLEEQDKYSDDVKSTLDILRGK